MNLDTDNATQKNLKYISPEGLRQDSAHTYLHPRLQSGGHPNLNVLVEHQVIRVLFDGNTASGIEIQPNPMFSNDTTVQSVKAKRMVVVSSGALGTPPVLERSGVGNPDVLKAAGVDVVSEVPGVGENYMDHLLLTYPYQSSLLPNETVDALYGGREDLNELIAENAPILGWNAADVTAKIRPSDDEAAALGPEFLEAWNEDFKNEPNKPIVIITSLNG